MNFRDLDLEKEKNLIFDKLVNFKIGGILLQES